MNNEGCWRGRTAMLPPSDALQSWWRRLAFVGHYSGIEGVVPDETNRVLRYHSVGGGWYDDIPVAAFREQLSYLTREYEVVDLPDVLARSDRKRVALTFDDGYRDFYDNVLPLLHEYDVPATVFLPVAAVECAPAASLDRFDYDPLSEAQLRELVDDPLVSIGNHTVTHPRLADLDDDRLEAEIVDAKEQLEDALSITVSRFCYPHNAFDERAVAIVRDTHEFGVANRGRFEPVTPETDRANIPRIPGSAPFYELCWNLSDAATSVGRAGRRVLDIS